MDKYVELHCHSNFSLLDGASHPEELLIRAAELGMPALALTDRDAVYGAPRFFQAADGLGIKPILGAEISLTGNHHLTLLVEDDAGWHNLCYLISRARHSRPKGEAMLDPEELVGCTGGLIALSGCRKGKIAQALLRGDRDSALATARRYRELFGPENFWIELQRHHLPGDAALQSKLNALGNYLKLGCVATNNVHYAVQQGHRLQDVLVCIDQLKTLDQAAKNEGEKNDGRHQNFRRLNSEYYLKSGQEMAVLFRHYPHALTSSFEIAERCHFELQYGLQDLPPFPTPHGMSSIAYLRRLCEEGFKDHYINQMAETVHERGRNQLIHELEVIERVNLANYFLIVWDIVRFANIQGIRCQGRGSAANSLVAYLLKISPIDPLSHDLVFERFLSEERQVVPDIDIDFDAERREEVIQYVYQKYGPEYTAMACTYVTFRSRSAIRDISKVLGMLPTAVAAATRILDGEPLPENDSEHDDVPLNMLLDLCDQIEGFPRHLGIHSGGMIVTGRPLQGRVPTEPATKEDRVVVQWDKEGLEDTGLVKIDILALRILSAITESLATIEALTGHRPDIDNFTFDDPAVYEMISQADTIGVFQVESRAQANTLPRLKPKCFNDLIVAISLIRPGPIQGNMVHPFLRRRLGLEPVTFAHPTLEPALGETLGVILFQEQVLKVARDMAGFSAGQGEQLRRALGSKRAGEAIARFQDQFLTGARAKGVPADIAERVFDKLLAFGGYSFAKSHAASFAVIVYQSAWLKHFHFIPFFAALLNNQPMGFWNPAVLVNEAKRHGVEILSVHLHKSREVCWPTSAGNEGGIRLGFNYVKGLKEEHLTRILEQRVVEPFKNLADFYKRVKPGRREAENLIMAGALDSWGIPRRQLLWELGTLHHQDGGLDLDYEVEVVDLPQLTAAEAMLVEHDVQGLSTGDHVMTFYREWLLDRRILGSEGLASCRDGERVQVAGLSVVHQAPPTAKGHRFITLEDQDGMMNIVIRPKVYKRYRRILHEEQLLIIEGIVQRQGGPINILATRAAGLQAAL